ncbi:MAG: M4 family metallopeptidase [Deltaproteobacteria bacterium]|nr:M4 family metallopeptidase [Deltaproteobacteria bacterium]
MRRESRLSRWWARGCFGAIAITLAACWTAGCTKKDDDRTPRERLESDTGTRWVVKLDPVTGTPRIAAAIDPIPPSAVNGVSYEIAARSFLDKYKDLFSIKNVFEELAFLGAIENEAGEAVAAFQQRAGGLPIDRKLLTVAFRADKSIATISGATRPRAAEAVGTPALTADAARAAVEADLKKRYPDFDSKWIATPPTPASVLFPDGAGAKLAWALDVELASANVTTTYSYRIDAMGGGVLEAFDVRAGVAGSGTDVLGATRALRVSADNSKPGTWIMVQPAEGGRSAIATGSADTNQFPLSSPNLTTWDQRPSALGGTGAAVSAHANLAEVQDYFRTRFKWSSYDNKGSPLKVFVHDPSAKDLSAYWNPQTKSIHFDDGSVHKGGPYKPFAAARDVCAHEYTHGVMQHRIPGNGLVNMNESGAINEALGDIFGAFAEKAIGGGGRTELFGEAFFAPGFRDLAHPTNPKVAQNLTEATYRTPDTYTKKFIGFSDGGGVHINSGIVANAWWLMTMGGTHDTTKLEVKGGLGMQKSEDLWWNAVLEFQPTMGIPEAADITIATALRMYKETSPEFKAVACAWVATEVVSEDEIKANYGVRCAPCIEPEAGKPSPDACVCRSANQNEGSLCRTDPGQSVCTEVQTFTGKSGDACTGYLYKSGEQSRCFCEQSNGNILCPKPYQFTPPRGCPEEGGFKSYYGAPGTSCSGNYADVDADGNEINQTGSGVLGSCSIETIEGKWESASGILDCNAGDGGGTPPPVCPP